MEACQKCNFALAPDTAECPACGVILAKLRPAPSLPRPTGALPPPFPATPPNPYAPPVAPVEGLPAPPPVPQPRVPVQDVITPMTLSALVDARPWIRFLVGYGFVMIALMLVGALGLLALGVAKPGMMPVALIYLLYGVVGLTVLLPLYRSTKALSQLGAYEASAVLETFAIEQSAFWRRSGLICVVSLVFAVILLVIGGFAGFMAAMSR